MLTGEEQVNGHRFVSLFCAKLPANPARGSNGHKRRGGTSIGGAIDETRRLMAAQGLPALRYVIDMSGDGAKKAGRSVSFAAAIVHKLVTEITGAGVFFRARLVV